MSVKSVIAALSLGGKGFPKSLIPIVDAIDTSVAADIVTSETADAALLVTAISDSEGDDAVLLTASEVAAKVLYKPVAGKIGPFDPGVDTGAETATGNLTSAVSSVITADLIGSLLVTIPTQPDANYMVFLTYESEGTVADDEDLLPMVIDTKTTTTFIIRVLTGSALTRSVSISVLVVPVSV